MALQPFVGPWPLFSCVVFFTQTVGLLGRGISPSQGRYLHTGQLKQNKRTQTSMALSEIRNPRSERSSALDRASTVIGLERVHSINFPVSRKVTQKLSSEVPTPVTTKSSIFSDITPCSPLKVNRRS
jgi:hypothetical protein